jgi:hypothetical protein
VPAVGLLFGGDGTGADEYDPSRDGNQRANGVELLQRSYHDYNRGGEGSLSVISPLTSRSYQSRARTTALIRAGQTRVVLLEDSAISRTSPLERMTEALTA